MNSLLFAINAVTPIVLLVTVGYCLKKIGWMDPKFCRMANKLVFHVFLPALLFLNIYKIDDIVSIDLGYILYAELLLLAVFLISLPAVLSITKQSTRRGALWQACFRSNYALVGIPLAQSLFGDAGVTVASLLSVAVVPTLNVLATVSLTVFGSAEDRPSVRRVLLGIVKNPLIQGVALGLLALLLRSALVSADIGFRLTDIKPVYRLIEDLSKLATPLALLCLGAQFEFSAIKELRREIVFGTLMRTLIVPVLGIGTALLLFRSTFNGAHFAAFVAVFATPVATSSVPMAQEMKGDVVLAGQIVVWSTVFSAASLFLISFALRSMGIF